MTADSYPSSRELVSHIVTRIVNEVKGIIGAVYDGTPNPPGMTN